MTRDVDAVFDESKAIVRKLSMDIAVDRGWPEDWLNDGIKGFISHKDNDKDSKFLFRSYPAEDQAGLRVMVAAPRYLFAMKCMAMRIDAGTLEESTDIKDIRALAEASSIYDAETALNVVSEFYPKNVIKPATQFGIEEIFEGWSPNGPSNLGKDVQTEVIVRCFRARKERRRRIRSRRA